MPVAAVALYGRRSGRRWRGPETWRRCAVWAIVFGKRRAGGAPLRRLARAGRCGAPAGPLRAEAGIDLTITGGGVAYLPVRRSFAVGTARGR